MIIRSCCNSQTPFLYNHKPRPLRSNCSDQIAKPVHCETDVPTKTLSSEGGGQITKPAHCETAVPAKTLSPDGAAKPQNPFTARFGPTSTLTSAKFPTRTRKWTYPRAFQKPGGISEPICTSYGPRTCQPMLLHEILNTCAISNSSLGHIRNLHLHWASPCKDTHACTFAHKCKQRGGPH